MSAADGSAAAADFPTQDELYSVFMASCGAHGVRKPHKGLTRLLENFAAGFKSITAPPHMAGVAASAAVKPSRLEVVDQLADDAFPVAEHIPLALRKEVPMGDPIRGAHWGNEALLVLLDVCHYCPLLEVMDWSIDFCRLYDADAYKLTPASSGNYMVAALSKWAARHPSVKTLRLKGQAVGCTGLHALMSAVEHNGNIVEVIVEESNIDPFLWGQFQKLLLRNRQGLNTCRPPAFECLTRRAPAPGGYDQTGGRVFVVGDRQVVAVDRKTSVDRRLFRLLLAETGNSAFGVAMTMPPFPSATKSRQLFQAPVPRTLKTGLGTPTRDSERYSLSTEHSPTASIGGAGADDFNTSSADRPPGLVLTPQEQDDFVLSSARCTFAEVMNVCQGLRGDGKHLFIVECGTLKVELEGVVILLQRGDYFGDVSLVSPPPAPLLPADPMDATDPSRSPTMRMLQQATTEGGPAAAFPFDSSNPFTPQLIATTPSLVPPGRFCDQQERGYAFRVPLTACRNLLQFWEAQSARTTPLLQTVAAFQGLPRWVMVKMAQQASWWRINEQDLPTANTPSMGAATPMHDPSASPNAGTVLMPTSPRSLNPVVLPKGKPFGGLLVVVSGTFRVRGHRGGGGPVMLTRGDVFGEEAAVMRKGVGSVDIVASSLSATSTAASPIAKDLGSSVNGGSGRHEVLFLPPAFCQRHVIPTVRVPLYLCAKAYSDQS